MSRKFFGTDGIRGRVGTGVVNAEHVLKLGWAAGRVLSGGQRRKVLIGKDTRISGYLFESALQAGLSSAGVDIRLLGPMPTPAIAYLTRTFRACAGIVISASHNPYYDNGIKFFSQSGAKLPDEIEREIEAEMERPFSTVDSAELGKAERVDDAAGRYVEFCKSTIPLGMSLAGLNIVIDCAHGATYHVAPSVFRELGAKIDCIGIQPDGLNINQACGSTHPQGLQQRVRERGADLGIAFDGDGDRVLMVDRNGDLVDGDELLYIIACARKRSGSQPAAVVGTVMTNLGLEHALAAEGIGLKRAAVGDRYVLEQMRAHGLMLGGETSGHIICLDRTTTGDGIVSALQVLHALVDSGRDLSELRGGVRKFPQQLISVPVDGPANLNERTDIQSAVQSAEQRLGARGRVLLRPSGTEPLVRVMVEGEDAGLVEAVAQELAEFVRSAMQQARA